jgi:hypothetical protein
LLLSSTYGSDFQNVNGIVFLDGIDFPSPNGDRGYEENCTPEKMVDYMRDAPDNMIIIYGKELGCCWIKDIQYSGQATTQGNRVVAMKGSLAQTTQAIISIQKVNYSNPDGDLGSFAVENTDAANEIAQQYAQENVVAIYSRKSHRIWIKDITRSGEASYCPDCTTYLSGKSISPSVGMIEMEGLDWNNYLGDRDYFSGLDYNSAIQEASKHVGCGYIFPFKTSSGEAWLKDKFQSGQAVHNSDISTFIAGDLVSRGDGIIGFRGWDFQDARGDLSSYYCTSDSEAVQYAVDNIHDVYTVAIYSSAAQRVWIKDLRKSGGALRKSTHVVFMKGVHMDTLIV